MVSHEFAGRAIRSVGKRQPRSLSARGLVVLLALAGAALKPAGSAAMASTEQNAKEPPSKRVLIVTGQDYPGHKWRETAPVLAEGLAKDARLRVEVVEAPAFLASPELDEYDAVVLHFMDWEQPDPGPEARANLKRFVEGGKGLFLVHFACGAFQEWPEFRDLAGRAWDPKMRAHDPHGEFRVEITDTEHPITEGLGAFDTVDELYTCLTGDRPVDLLAVARSKVDGKDYPMAFSFAYGKGRVFHSPLGHDVVAIGNERVAELFRRGCAWAAGLPPVPEGPAGMGAARGKKVVFIAGTPSHGTGEHEWDQDAKLLKQCLDTSPNAGDIRTEVHFEGWPDDAGALDDADAIVMLSDGLGGHPLANPERSERVRALMRRGCGLACIHYAVAAPADKQAEFLEWIGGYWEMGYSENPINTVKVFPASPEHPICKGWQAFTIKDEFYYRIRFGENDARVAPVMAAMLPKDDPQRETLAWAVERADGGRGFGFTGGHFHDNWSVEPFRTMVLNAILWAAKAPVPDGGVQSTVE